MATRAPLRTGARAALLAIAPITLVTTLATRAADPFADRVVDYEPGEDVNPNYVEPLTTLGSPERFTGEGIFPGVVSPFNPPFGVDEILSIGRGGFLVVEFDEPVTDDPDNPFGIDLLVFGNAAFIDDDYPRGIVAGLFSADGGSVEMSGDGVDWFVVPGVPADGMFPTAGYLDVGPYDEDPGAVETVFTRPVDPGMALDDMMGLGYAELLALYDGAGGGAGVDLAAIGLDTVRYVRITNPVDAERDIQIDAFADVAPRVRGDVDGDGVVGFQDVVALLAAWGGCPDPPLPCPADLDDDGDVDFQDLVALLSSWSR